MYDVKAVAKYANSLKGKAAKARAHKRWRLRNPIKWRANCRRCLARWRVSPKGKAHARKHARLWRKRYPGKYRAHKRVASAIRAGSLLRQPCEVCGNRKAQAHHSDYHKPLHVRWLCRKHHVGKDGVHCV